MCIREHGRPGAGGAGPLRLESTPALDKGSIAGVSAASGGEGGDITHHIVLEDQRLLGGASGE